MKKIIITLGIIAVVAGGCGQKNAKKQSETTNNESVVSRQNDVNLSSNAINDSVFSAAAIITKDTTEGAKNVYLIHIGKYISVNEVEDAEPDDCAIEIEIKENAKYAIKIKGVQQKQGIYEVSSIEDDNIYIKFNDIQGMYSDNTIFIQNYGNAMNEYNHFTSCDKKYIYLVRKEQ